MNSYLSLVLTLRVTILAFLISTTIGCATIGAKMAQQEVIQMAATGCEGSGAIGVVSLDKCELTNRVIKDWGIKNGLVGFDRLGRLELRGEYDTEEDADKAFVAAQTIVGTENVSQLTPRNIKVLRWQPIEEYKVAEMNQSGPGKKLALLVGISKFASGLTPIKTAANDVRSIADTLVKYGFQKPVILVDSAATRANIIQAVDALKKSATANDTILFYLSTHGAPPNKYGELSMIPYDFSKEGLKAAKFDDKVSHNDTEYLEVAKSRYNTQNKYGIPPRLLSDLMLRSKAKSVVGVLDLCYSGAALGQIFKPLGSKEFQEKEMTSLRGVSSQQISRTLGYTGTKDLVVSSENLATGLNDSLVSDNYKYANFGVPTIDSETIRGNGRVVITASGSNEKSYYDLSEAFKQTGISESFFTHYFVEGLNLTKGETRMAFKYALPRTQRIVWETAKKNQVPQYNTNPNDNKLSISLFD